MPETSEMKPCPFCGSKPHVYYERYEFDSDDAMNEGANEHVMYRVYCSHCGIVGITRRTRKSAVDAWNRRDGEGYGE